MGKSVSLRKCDWPFLICALILLSDASPLQAQPPPPGDEVRYGSFSVGVATGFYQPSLDTFNSIINNRNQAIMEDPNFLLPANPEFRVERRNILAGEIGPGPWLGLEGHWQFSRPFGIRLIGGVWRGERLVTDIIPTFLRSNLPEIPAPRSARYNLVLNQVFLEWRYFFLNDPETGRISVDLGVLGLAVGQLTMDSLVKVVDARAPGGGFASISSTEATGVGYTSRYGVTGEYFLGKNFAIALSAHYVLGQINELKVSRHFPAGFPQVPIPEPLSLQAGVPLPVTFPAPVDGETISTAAAATDPRGVEQTGPQTNVVLELDGIEVTAFFRFYF